MVGENSQMMDDLELDFEIEKIPLDDIELSKIDKIEEDEEDIDITPQDLSKIEVREYTSEGLGELVETPDIQIPAELDLIEEPTPGDEIAAESFDEPAPDHNIGAMETLNIIEATPEPEIGESKEIRPVEEEVSQARQEELEQLKAQRLKFSDMDALEDAYTFETDDEIISIEGSDLDKVIYGAGAESPEEISEITIEESPAPAAEDVSDLSAITDENFELTVENEPIDVAEVELVSEPTEELIPMPESIEDISSGDMPEIDPESIPELDFDLSIIPDIEDSDEDEPITLSMEELNNIDVSEEPVESFESVNVSDDLMPEMETEAVSIGTDEEPILVIEEPSPEPVSFAPEGAEELVEIEIDESSEDSELPVIPIEEETEIVGETIIDIEEPIATDEFMPETVPSEDVIEISNDIFEEEPVMTEESPVEDAVEIDLENITEDSAEFSEIQLEPYNEPEELSSTGEIPPQEDYEMSRPEAELPSLEELDNITVPQDIQLEPITDDFETIEPLSEEPVPIQEMTVTEESSAEPGLSVVEEPTPAEEITLTEEAAPESGVSIDVEEPLVLDTSEPVEFVNIEPVIVQSAPVVEEPEDMFQISEELPGEPEIEEVSHAKIRIVEEPVDEIQTESVDLEPVTDEAPAEENIVLEPVDLSDDMSGTEEIAVPESAAIEEESEPVIEISESSFDEEPILEIKDEPLSEIPAEPEEITVEETVSAEPEEIVIEEAAVSEPIFDQLEPAEVEMIEEPASELVSDLEEEIQISQTDFEEIAHIEEAEEGISIVDTEFETVNVNEPPMEISEEPETEPEMSGAEPVEIEVVEAAPEEEIVLEEDIPIIEEIPVETEPPLPETPTDIQEIVIEEPIEEPEPESSEHVEIAAEELDILQSEVAEQERIAPEMYSLDKLEEQPAPVNKAQVITDKVDGLSESTKQEIKKVMSYLDTLLENLPEDKIKEFSQSEYYDLYVKILDKLGV